MCIMNLFNKSAFSGSKRRSLGRRLAVTAAWLGVTVIVAGCPATQFINEGPGQATDAASGRVPSGAIGACRVRFSERPPLVNKALWDNLPRCTPRTPRRYLRVGFGRDLDGKRVEQAKGNVDAIMAALKAGAEDKSGNVRMSRMLRTVQQQGLGDVRLSARVERATGRSFPCDYTYLLNTTDKQYSKLASGDTCPAYAFDPKTRRNQCLFDTSMSETTWLTSAWSCLAFTDTVGEGQSCYRLCSFDDYCAAQVSCAAPNFDLVLCALGVCTPERVRGLY